MLKLICITIAVGAGLNLLGGIVSFLILRTSLLRGMQIQSRDHLRKVFWSRFPIIALNLSILFVLVTALLWLAQQAFDLQWQGTLAFLAQFLVLACLDDAWFYLWHRSLHRNAYLYKKIHHIHHRSTAPLPLEYIYVHPLEWIVRFIAIPIGVGAIYLFNGSVSVHALWAFIFWLNFHEIALHSGIRSTLGRYIPYLATTEYHELHHLKKRGNYASSFTIWDRLLGTRIGTEV